MALNPANLSSTPPEYQTYSQAQQLYDYANKLAQGATRDKEITSPWQGVRMMADALTGGYVRNRAGQLEQGSRTSDSQAANPQDPWVHGAQPFQSYGVPAGVPGMPPSPQTVQPPVPPVPPKPATGYGNAPAQPGYMTALMTPPPDGGSGFG